MSLRPNMTEGTMSISKVSRRGCQWGKTKGRRKEFYSAMAASRRPIIFLPRQFPACGFPRVGMRRLGPP